MSPYRKLAFLSAATGFFAGVLQQYCQPPWWDVLVILAIVPMCYYTVRLEAGR